MFQQKKRLFRLHNAEECRLVATSVSDPGFFFPDPDQPFFLSPRPLEFGSGSAKNPDPIRKNPDLDPDP